MTPTWTIDAHVLLFRRQFVPAGLLSTIFHVGRRQTLSKLGVEPVVGYLKGRIPAAIFPCLGPELPPWLLLPGGVVP